MEALFREEAIRLRWSFSNWRLRHFDSTVDGQNFGLAPFDSTQKIQPKRSWKNHIMEGEVEEVEELYRQVEGLQVIPEKEVNGVDIICTFLKHRVQPLQ